MLEHLAPARRRLVLAVVGIITLAVVAAAVTVVLRRDPPVEPVRQDAQGPVLLVPGYGGSTTSLEVLATTLRAAGRDARVVPPEGSGTEDLRVQAETLDRAVRAALAETGAPSVDVIGYSAGGVIVRLWVAELGGDAVTRRVVTLASPHHGTDLAGLAGDLAPDACPEACQQLVPDSDVLRDLNGDDETPAGPRWVALWTIDDKTVVPPESGSLEGALDFSVQQVCPGLVVAHADVPRTPAVMAMVLSALGRDLPDLPGSSVCAAAAVSP
ncbi:MAG: lipase family alpha/beta hydrolase [Nocardioides sp.]